MFSHLNIHTEYSLLNGAVRISELVDQAKKYNMSALALTDYGNIFGAVEFFVACKNSGIKPVIGATLFIPSHDDHQLKQFRKNQDSLWQIILLIKNKNGYKNLSQLLTLSYLQGFYYKPRIDTQLLKQFADGLIMTSGGFGSEINFHLHNNHFEQARDVAKKFISIFGDNFYLELQDNGLGEQKRVNEQLIVIGKELGVGVFASNNVHYLNRDDAEAFEVMRGVQLNRIYHTIHDYQKFSTDEYYFKSTQEMENLFGHEPQVLENTQHIVDQCDFSFDFKTYHFPNYQTPPGMTLDQMLENQALEGLELLWNRIKFLSGVTESEKEKYFERLKLELKVIQNMGFSGYFLIVSDFIKWAKKNQIPVGPGRGSGAGSLVAYALRITDLDPLPYNLLFERFLNPERVSMPDFDIDFCQDRRQEVIDYVAQKYGHVSQIITFGKMKAKAVLRDVGRVMDLEYEYVDKIAKLIPSSLSTTLKSALEEEPRLAELYKTDTTVKRLIEVSLKLEGMNRHASTHAAGVIITDKPLPEFVPLYRGSNEDIVTQFDMKYLEKIGLIKFDFLGLKTLTVIQKAIQNIFISKQKKIEIDEIPLADSQVYEALSSGDGSGIFQLESSGMRDLMVRLKPGCFEDIIALVALYRPGPLNSGMVDDFIQRKRGTKKIEYSLPELEMILKDTYGVIVYQEQVMQIASKLANYSLGEADLLRRAMGKKKAEEMASQRARFLEGAAQNKIPLKKAEEIFDLMANFAEYGFNKSHSAAYALISYQTAYLKTHFCAEYMAAIMSTEMEDTDKILFFINDCKDHHINILPPDINQSSKEFLVVDEKNILYGLGALKGVGDAAIEAVIEARKNGGAFTSYYDFCSRVDLRRVTKKVIEVFIKSGAFDVFVMARKSMFDLIPEMTEAALRKQKEKLLGQRDLFGGLDKQQALPVGITIKTEDDWTQNEKLGFEKDVFGLYFSDHPLKAFEDILTKLTTHHISHLHQVRHDEEVILGGTLISSRVIKTKKGDNMAFAMFEDLSAKIEVIVFPKVFKEYGHLLNSEKPLLIKGHVESSEETVKFFANSLNHLTDAFKTFVKAIHIDIELATFDHHHLNKMMEILQKYPGDIPVKIVVSVEREGQSYQGLYDLPIHLRVMPCEPLQYYLNHLFNRKVVRFL